MYKMLSVFLVICILAFSVVMVAVADVADAADAATDAADADDVAADAAADVAADVADVAENIVLEATTDAATDAEVDAADTLTDAEVDAADALVDAEADTMVGATAISYSGAIGGYANSPKLEYNTELFDDIDENQWYGVNERAVIKAVYELQIMSGKGYGIFDPDGNITLAEAIKMAAVVHNIYLGGDGTFAQTTPWYKEYVDYAIQNGIIDDTAFDGDYDKSATRAEMAFIFANSVPQDMLQPINAVNYLPDVPLSDNTPIRSYGEEIYKLYRAGVLSGNDARGTYLPYSNITRAEAAAIICRIVLPAERVRLDLSQVIISGDYFELDYPAYEYNIRENVGLLDAYETFVETGYENAPMIIISTNIEISEFKYIEIELDESVVRDKIVFRETRVICELEYLTPERSFAVAWLDIGTIPNRGISFVDENGMIRCFSISSSGYDGSLLLNEYYG